MKKHLLSILMLAGLASAAQNLKESPPMPYNPVKNFGAAPQINYALPVVRDTLEYFFNKHFYFNPWTGPNTNSPNGLFSSLSMPYPTSTLNLSHMGSIFRNTGPVTISGLQAIVIKRQNSVSQSVPVRLYLCNVNVNTVQMPPLDSVLTSVSSSTTGDWVGANFTNPITVNGNFAVLFKAVPTAAGDTVGLFLNNAATATSTFAAYTKFGENLGVIRYLGAFQTAAAAFGGGRDPEFIVAPRIVFGYTAGVSVITPSLCTGAQGSFSNVTTSTHILENRQFNFNKMYQYWANFINLNVIGTNSLIGNAQPDSIYIWQFSGSSTPVQFSKNANAVFTASGNQTASLTALYRQSFDLGFHQSQLDGAAGTINVSTQNAPVITVSGPSLICTGASATLTASGNTTFTWTQPPSNSAFVTVSPNSTTVYTVSAANNGCTGVKLYTLTVVPQPTIVISGPSSVCMGKSAILTASGVSTYTWLNNNSSAASIVVTTSVAGVLTYSVSGDIANCPTAQSIKNVTINAPPSVIVTAPSTLLCTKATGGTAMVLEPDPTGGNFLTLVAPGGTFTPNNTGTFTSVYSYTDASTACSATANIVLKVVDCTGIESLTSDVPAVYPNPAVHGNFSIRNLVSPSVIQVFNAAGMLIRTLEGKGDVQVDLGQQPAGIYLVKVTGGGKTATLKVVSIN